MLSKSFKINYVLQNTLNASNFKGICCLFNKLFNVLSQSKIRSTNQTEYQTEITKQKYQLSSFGKFSPR